MVQPLHAPPVEVIHGSGGGHLDLINPSDIRPNMVKQLVFADFGQGKTSYGATAPHALIISSERGEASLFNPANPIDPRSRVIHADSWDDMRIIYDRIRTNWQGWGEFESIVIDSLSDLQVKCLYEVMEDEEKKDSKRPKGVPQRNDYQKVTNLMGRMVARYRDLPKHVIFLAQYRNDKSMEGPGTGTTSRAVRADLTPATYKAVAGAVDILSYLQRFPERIPQGYANAGQPTGRMIVVMMFDDPSMQFAVKRRYNLPPYIENPTFQKVIESIYAGGQS